MNAPRLDLAAMLKHKQRVVQTMGGGVEALFKKNKITRYSGQARLAGPGRVVVEGQGGPQELSSRHVLIATGSVPATLPGIELDGDRVMSSTEALALAEELGMRPLAAHCHRGLGLLYRKVGRREQAQAELTTAAELYSAMEMTSWSERAQAELAEVAP